MFMTVNKLTDLQVDKSSYQILPINLNYELCH